MAYVRSRKSHANNNAAILELILWFSGPRSMVIECSYGQRISNGESWAPKCEGREVHGRGSLEVIREDEESESAEPTRTTPSSRKRCFAWTSNVFNADQVDGFSIPEMTALPETQRIEGAETFFQQTGILRVETPLRYV